MTEETENEIPGADEATIEETVADVADVATEASVEADGEGDDDGSGIAEAVAALGLKSMSLQELKEKSPADLLAFAETFEVENANSMRKQDMMFAILKTLAEEGVEISGSGTMEVLQDGFGFLRSPEANYLPGPDDIYVSPSQIRKYGLRTGDSVEGAIRSPREGERYFALTSVTKINFESPENVRHKVHFDNLTPLYPEERLNMELPDPTVKDRSGRVIDIVAPLGKGQRCLIVAPPRVGKTVMLQNIAKSIETNHPECYLIVLLIDERPEEVTDMQRRRGHRLDLRRAGDPPRPGGRDGHRKGQAPGRAQARRRHPAGLGHPSGPRLQHHRPVVGQGADRRCRRQRPAASQALLRRGAERGGGRLALDHRHRPDRHRQPDGRSHLRRVQGHR
jgi:transcription termination factor Rho